MVMVSWPGGVIHCLVIRVDIVSPERPPIMNRGRRDGEREIEMRRSGKIQANEPIIGRSELKTDPTYNSLELNVTLRY